MDFLLLDLFAQAPDAGTSSVLKFFALAALFFGGIFFLYALKYYMSIALILIANASRGNGYGNGRHKGNGNGNGNGNGLRGIPRNGDDHDAFHYKPFISVHLPLYNEKSVVDRLLQSVTSFDYENFEVIVADDSSDETSDILDQRWANHPRVKISRRHDRNGFKGGALQKALEVTDPRAEFIVVFDADFIPPPDILQQFLAYFFGVNGNGNGNGNGHNGEDEHPKLVDDRLAVVQGYQWHVLNASENWITRGIRTEFAGSYVIERSSQELLGSMKMIAGSVFMIRADVLRQYGWGTSITEDWELTIRLYLGGYKVLYTPFIQAPSEIVATFKQLALQRMRWAEGHTFNVKKYFLRVITSPNLETIEKLEWIYYAPYYLQSVFFVLGTGFWLLSEIVFRYRLPMLAASIGWALVFTNALSLVFMNLAGLFMERGVRRNWRGLLSFILLTYLMVPYQAYASLKGLIEPHEGGWHRTEKTGVITDMVD
ncbi:MAG: glycosyltransferase [Chloroflexi bacterium]|nr:glycosyltransferase [Chloroflexota bacterium]